MTRSLFSGGWSLLRTLPTHPRLFERFLRGPLTAQVQTIDRCNGECAMCPYASLRGTGPPGEIESGLYTRILKELRGLGTVRKFLPHLHSEPLLDGSLEDRVREARDVLGPRTVLQIITNGTLLSRERAESLSKAGIDEITVSLDAFREETYRKIRPGFDFGAVKAQVEALLEGPRPYTLGTAFVLQQDNEGEEDDFVRHWRSRGAAVEVSMVCNRVGSLAAFSDLAVDPRRRRRDAVMDPLRRFFPACISPFSRLFVLLDGRVLLCCHDWKHEAVVGDLSSQGLAEVWNGEPLKEYRAALWRRRFEYGHICSRCSIMHQR